MNEALTLRAAGVVDAAALAATIAAAFEEYRGKLAPESGALRETTDAISTELSGDAAAIVAERDGAIIGCVMTKPIEGDLYFGRLSVLPDARGHGVAHQLLRAVEAYAQSRDCAGVRLSVRVALPENRNFFAGQGYRETGRDAHDGFDHPTMIHMRKPV